MINNIYYKTFIFYCSFDQIIYRSKTMKVISNFSLTTLFVVLAIFNHQKINAQQPISPLEASFATYQQMKSITPYKMEWIPLGPTLNSARADVVQVDYRNPGTMYVGFGSGGVWKTTNNGLHWHPIFENQVSYGIGDMELAPSNPNIIYVGTGENLKKPRNFTIPGNGMYRSDDAGKTWKHIGLDDSWAIAEIEIHPQNPEIVLVAVLGHLWSTNENRGLFRTINGGKSWEKVLYINEKTGANEVVIAKSNPRVMYASTWEVYPSIHGANSGVHRSMDGGKTWIKCTNGLPSGEKVGRIGLAVSSYNSKKVYALIDNLTNPSGQSSELYKSVDGGINWTKTHNAPNFNFSVIGWYFTDVYLNPKDDEEVYCLGIRLAKSNDGGKTFKFLGGNVMRTTPSMAKGFHLDQCELWINPTNPKHIAAGNDGGFYVSYDKGESWFHYNNIPVGEFYDLTIDQKNYLIYGGTQDDATVMGPPSEYNPNFPDKWKYVWIDPWDGGDGCVSQVDPEDENTIYYSMQHGNAIRYDRKEDTTFAIQPRRTQTIKDTLVFNYITPYFISPHASKTLYHGGNYVFKSLDRGNTWETISPNLSLSSIKDKQSFALGALVESKLQKGLLFAGTDKGAFWVSQNDGKSWEEYSHGLANNYIRSICPSQFSDNRVYLAMTGINYDDLNKYLYASEDLGKTWVNISHGLPNEPINTILEDRFNENILYVGTFRGVYISINRGKDWQLLGINLPNTAIADLEIHHNTSDLVVATHGRGIYKINLNPFYQMLEKENVHSETYLFKIPDGTLPYFNSLGGEPDFNTLEKTTISFWLPSDKKVILTLYDTNNQPIWSKEIDGKTGINQYRWDLITQKEESDKPYFVHYNKFVKQGDYLMVLKIGEKSYVQPFLVKSSVSPYKK
jgi:photosystem II stability/assembly factor-like uncharacterized protein